MTDFLTNPEFDWYDKMGMALREIEEGTATGHRIRLLLPLFDLAPPEYATRLDAALEGTIFASER